MTKQTEAQKAKQIARIKRMLKNLRGETTKEESEEIFRDALESTLKKNGAYTSDDLRLDE